MGLLKQGLSADDVILDGTGLETFGFVWSCYSSFIPVPGTTSTIWSMTPGTSQTVWTGVTGIIYGPC